MKADARIIQWYILKEFLKRFIPALVILFFIFVLQTFWVYFDELAGKGLSLWVIFKFFYYFSPNILLYSIPLAILLAGLMTYGNLGENYELAAIKSAGVSVWKSMRYLILFNVVLALFVLFVANVLQPVGNTKFTELRTAIFHKVPAAAIRQGIFSTIGNYTIKVNEKYGENKHKLKDIILHEEIYGIPDRVITADSGKFVNAGKYLQLELYNGQYFEELTRRQRTNKDRQQLPAMQTDFDTYIINIDVSGMNKLKEKKSGLRIYHMLNMHELNYAIDSLRKELANKKTRYHKEIRNRHWLYGARGKGGNWNKIVKDTTISPSDWNSAITRAYGKAQANISYIKRKKTDFKEYRIFINKYIHALQEKISLPFYIFLLFLIGIPLGAVIRKGGFGLPFVLGLLLYTTFYLLAMLGQNLAEQNIIAPWLGAWIPVLVMIPLAVYMLWMVSRIPEVTFWNNAVTRLKNFLRKIHLLPAGKKQLDAVFIPKPAKISRLENLNYTIKYELPAAYVLYFPHTSDLPGFIDELKRIKTQSGSEEVIGQIKLDDDLKYRYGFLGDSLMIIIPEGDPVFITDLDIAYRLENDEFKVDKNQPLHFDYYKKLISKFKEK